MQENYSAYERFLGFERLQNTRALMRARSVYIIGWAFIFTQLINIFLMTMTYGGWILDHWVSVFGMTSVFLVIHTLRYTHNFTYFAFSFSFLLLAGVFGAAIQVNTGINTAILPLMVAGCLLNGFIGGARLVWIYAIASITFAWGLYFISAAAPPADMAERATYSARIFQRAAQVSLALLLVSAFSAFISNAMNRLFYTLENRIAVLETQNIQKTSFLETLTHELQTPIIGVNSMSGQLAATNLDADQTKLLAIVRKCTSRLARLGRDARELSKLDSQTFALEETSFNLREMIKHLIASLSSRANAKNIHIGTTYGSQLPEIYMGDAKRLKTVLRNITSNALKFTESGSVHIYVDGRLKGADEVDLRIAIKDTGAGIAPKNIDRVFNRFEQVGDMTYQKSSGRGNGLAIAREYIRFMGGDIRVESQVGTGSNFEISLALHSAEEQSDQVYNSAPLQTSAIESEQAA